jgi:Putative auto-transporter adhesin, head GIN domain
MRPCTPSARLAPLLSLALGLAACHPHVSGNGVYLEADCGVESFNAVKLDLGVQATIEVRPLAQGVTCVIAGDANLIPNIHFSTPGGVLQFTGAPDFDRILPLTLRITTPALSGVEASDAGASDGDSTTVGVTSAATLALTVVGHDRSAISVAGPGAPAGTESVTLSESASYFGFDYPVAGASVALSGHGRAEVQSTGDVTGSAKDSSVVVVGGAGACAVATSGAATCTAKP